MIKQRNEKPSREKEKNVATSSLRFESAIMRSAIFLPSWLSKKFQAFTVMPNCLAIEGVATSVSLRKGYLTMQLTKAASLKIM